MGIGSFFPLSFLFQTQTEERQSEARFGDFDEDNEARRRFRRRTRSKQTHTRVLNIWTKNDFDEEQDRSKPTLDLYVGWNMSLDNETGLDPPGVRGRPVTGLVAADYFAPGYFAWAVLIANLARIGYEEKNMYMAAYDWRLSFQNTEVCDQTLSRIISNIELLVATNGGHKAVIIPHSMGVLYFLRFMKWVEAPAPMGGGGGPDWCAKHIKAVMNIGDDCEW